MKKLLFIICIIFFMLPTCAETLHGSASYTVDSARDFLQDGLKEFIPTSELEGRYYDSDCGKNIVLIKKGITKNTKYKNLAAYYNPDGSLNYYGIIYRDNPYYTYYYYSSGMFRQFALSDNPDGEYPNKFYLYNSKGKLTGYGLDVTDKETYVYFPSGRLDNHCVGNTCYNENDKVLWTRDY